MDFGLDIQQQISTVDYDPKSNCLIVGGRECHKLIQISESLKKTMEIKSNFRKSAGTMQPIGYLEFNRINSQYFLAGSVQGTFAIWETQGNGKEIYFGKHHQAAIHRMNWDPRNEPLFVSGAQDSCLNLYDMRTKEMLQKFLCRTNPIRDVKYNPHEENRLMVAYDNGLMEYFDTRCFEEPILSRQCAHNSMIICMDWNSQQKNVLVSGSNEKDIKVWQVNSNEIEEKVKIQHIDGSAQIKWHRKDPTCFSVASLNRDISVTVYDITKPYRPKSIIKGHSEIITSFVYNEEETHIYTGSKDKQLRVQPVNSAIDVYKNCPKYPVQFNQYNDLLFKLEDIDQQFDTNSSDQDTLYQSQTIFKQITPNAQPREQPQQLRLVQSQSSFIVPQIPRNNSVQSQHIQSREFKQCDSFFIGQNLFLHPRPVALIQNVTNLFRTTSMDIDKEIDFLQQNYISTKDICFEHNSKIAQSILKSHLSQYWIGLKFLIQDYTHLQKELPVKQSFLNKDVSDDDKSPTEQPPAKTKTVIQNSNQVLTLLELQKLHKYFEKYPSAFKQELDCKNILLMDKNQLRIRMERMPYYKSLLKTQDSIPDLLMSKEAMLRALRDSIQDLIQMVIDMNELPTGYWMFACSKNYVRFKDTIIQKWTQAYLDLLLCFERYAATVSAVHECPIEAIKLSNKSSVVYVCSNCNNECGTTCSQCRTEATCIICQQPVKGLFLWCQVCQHGGHRVEMKNWFTQNKYCPSGCGHICFRQ